MTGKNETIEAYIDNFLNEFPEMENSRDRLSLELGAFVEGMETESLERNGKL